MTARCPKDPTHKEFITVAHVSEDWRVDEHGNFIDQADGGSEVVGKPDPGNTWTCAICGAEATVEN